MCIWCDIWPILSMVLFVDVPTGHWNSIGQITKMWIIHYRIRVYVLGNDIHYNYTVECLNNAPGSSKLGEHWTLRECLTNQPWLITHARYLQLNYANSRYIFPGGRSMKTSQMPIFCILPLEFEVNIDIHKHENRGVICSNRNKYPKEMSGSSWL